jgi:hypothetical protein
MTISTLLSLVVVGLLGATDAASVLWTGYVNDNQWTTQNNWYPNTVPGPNDDVTIDKGTVFVTIPTGVQSIVMGTNVDTPANLTFYHAFAVGTGGLQVKANGNLNVNSGLETITGTVSVDGTLTFLSGFISGVWTISSRGNGYFPGQGQRNIVAGSLTNAGTIQASGVIALNQSAQFVNNGNLNLYATTQFMVFDQSPAFFNSAQGTVNYNGGDASSVLRFQAPATLGTFNLNSGNMELYNVMTFTNALVIPAGSKVSALGNANTTFPAVSGAGTVIASGKLTTFTTLNNIATVIASGGQTQFTQGATATSVTLSGGQVIFGGNVVATNLLIQGGLLQGQGRISGSQVTISSVGANIGTTLVILNTLTIGQPSLVSFTSAGSLVIDAGATANVANNLNVSGPANTGGIQNSGLINVAQGATLQSQNININGTGSLQVAGSVSVSTCMLMLNNATISGSGNIQGSNTVLSLTTVQVASGFVVAKVADYTIQCPIYCFKVRTPDTQGAENFVFTQAH